MNTLPPRFAMPSALLIILLLWPSNISPSLAASTTAPINPFGAVEAYYRPAEAAELGLGWERIVFEWNALQPNGPTDWDTSHVPDAWLQNALDAHREVVGLIKNAPHWATGSDLLGAPPLGADKPIDDPANVFAAFVTKLVSYYGPLWHIHHWIIYNEPDIRPEDTDQFEFSGDETDYFHVIKTAYLAAHRADPQAVIHLAGTTWWQDVIHHRLLFLERFLRIATQDPTAAAHGLFFDVLSVHVYDQTELVWNMTAQLANLPASMGYPKPVWIDELNARPTDDGDWQLPDAENPVTLDQQADFIVQAAALGLAANVQRIGVYRLYDDVDSSDPNAALNSGWGLIRHDGSRRPAFAAWQTVIREMSGTAHARRVSNRGVTIVSLPQTDQMVTAIWNETDKPITVHTPYTRTSTLLSSTGDTLDLTPVAHGYQDEFILPPCVDPCTIEGSPRLLITTGNALPAIYEITADGKPPIRLN